MEEQTRKLDPVLCVAWILALLSMFFIRPDRQFAGYIDWRSLGILWGLMIIIQGWRKNGVFDRIGEMLLSGVSQGWQLAAVLIGLCFFSSMLITNDVALITFVPFALMILKNCKQEKMILPVVVLQTIAANLGSMLTPIGNPQNLYLYGLAGMGPADFVSLMLPYSLMAAVLLGVCIAFLPGKEDRILLESGESFGTDGNKSPTIGDKQSGGSRLQVAVYLLLFVGALLAVLRVVPWYVPVAAIGVVTLIMDRRILARADYGLLSTFIGFFIFTGNMGRIVVVRELLQRLMEGRELMVSVLASQCISNVPAALLLSGFTENLKELIVGVNLGGLGTLIASMASLISFKAFANEYEERRGKYLLWFSIINVLFLIVLLLGHLVLAK